MADNKYCVEYAKTGRSTCKYKPCNQKIIKNHLRVAKLTANFFDDDGDSLAAEWHHPICWFKKQTKMKKTSRRIEGEDDLQGFENVEPHHQSMLLELIEGKVLPDDAFDVPEHLREEPPKAKAKKVSPDAGIKIKGKVNLGSLPLPPQLLPPPSTSTATTSAPPHTHVHTSTTAAKDRAHPVTTTTSTPTTAAPMGPGLLVDESGAVYSATLVSLDGSCEDIHLGEGFTTVGRSELGPSASMAVSKRQAAFRFSPSNSSSISLTNLGRNPMSVQRKGQTFAIAIKRGMGSLLVNGDVINMVVGSLPFRLTVSRSIPAVPISSGPPAISPSLKGKRSREEDDSGDEGGGPQPPQAKKVKVEDSPPLPDCPFGPSCYRKNPVHFKEFGHPWLKASK